MSDNCRISSYIVIVDVYRHVRRENMRAAIYARVSTEDQAKEGYSLDAQVKRMEAYCKARGWTVGGRYIDEGHSGRTINRPAYSAMMLDNEKWDLILVLKMDRIHRNSVNFTLMMDHLRKINKEFNSIQESFDTTTAMGRFVMDIMQRIAQLESEQIGERVFMGMERKARMGEGHMGSGHPYGYVYHEGELLVLEEERRTVETIFRLRTENRSYQKIADRLNDNGIPSKKGLRWSRQAVWNIFNNPLYQGYIRWNGIIRKGQHSAIIGNDFDPIL